MNPGTVAWKSCVSKVKYETKLAVQLSALRNEQYNHKKLDYYHCKICRGWHLTSKRRMK